MIPIYTDSAYFSTRCAIEAIKEYSPMQLCRGLLALNAVAKYAKHSQFTLGFPSFCCRRRQQRQRGRAPIVELPFEDCYEEPLTLRLGAPDRPAAEPLGTGWRRQVSPQVHQFLTLRVSPPAHPETIGGYLDTSWRLS